jgi:hypothetical protein
MGTLHKNEHAYVRAEEALKLCGGVHQTATSPTRRSLTAHSSGVTGTIRKGQRSWFDGTNITLLLRQHSLTEDWSAIAEQTRQ